MSYHASRSVIQLGPISSLRATRPFGHVAPHMRIIRRVVVVLASACVASVFSVFAACSFGVDIDALSSCATGSCVDSGRDAITNDVTDATSADCPSGKGSAMVRVAGSCIDHAEVTNASYAQFLAASKDLASLSPIAAACKAQKDFTPSVWPVAAEALPVVNVDFCDAQFYCAWAGKTLCGSVAGGALPVSRMATSDDVWFGVCQTGNADRTACNTASTALANVGVFAGCTTPTGVNDLIGNAWEWVDSCLSDNDLSDVCFSRGGAYDSASAEQTCGFTGRSARRDYRAPNQGFRCCAP